MVIVFTVSFCYELRKPDCLIKFSNDFLWIYAKKKWNKIYVTDIVDIKYKKTQSGRIVVRSGTLKITTKDCSYSLYNIKDVEDVASILRKLKDNE